MSNIKAAYMSSARTFFILKKWEKAAVEFEKISENYGADGPLQEQLAICYQNMNLPFKEKEALEKALSLTNPEKIDKINILKEKLIKCKCR